MPCWPLCSCYNEWSRNAGRGLALLQLFYPSLEYCKETSKTIPLLTPNCSEWSERKAAAAYAIYASCISQTHWEKEAAAELFTLRKWCLLKLFRGLFSFGSSFCPRQCLKSQASPKEFPNSYYVMSSQLNLRIIL